MPKSALPEHINDPEEIENAFPDDSENGSFIRRLKKSTKTWFAFGPRATEWWAKWRVFPKTLFAIRGAGSFRIETDRDERDSSWDCLYSRRVIFWDDMAAMRQLPQLFEYTQGYLSRIQKYTRWSFQIQWPFMVAAHFTFRPEDVHTYGERKDTDGKQFFFYLGAHRDADRAYWFPSGYIGLNWK